MDSKQNVRLTFWLTLLLAVIAAVLQVLKDFA